MLCAGLLTPHPPDRRSPRPWVLDYFVASYIVTVQMERYKIHSEAAVYFITYCVVDWLPVFITAPTCDIVTNSLKFCHEQKGLRINAYAIMPTHLHAIVFDRDFDASQLEATLTDFRKFTGRSLSDYCIKHFPQCFAESLRKAAGTDRERRFWQSSRHPEAIESEGFWMQKLNYLHENPCRKGLVLRAQDWRYSSAAYYISDGNVSVGVPISPIDWS
jgi:putative transposase